MRISQWMGVAAAACFAAGASAAEGPFVENDGLVVIEVESCPSTKGWVLEKEQEGFTGQGYYTWQGGDRYGSASGEPLAYRILILQPGTYQFRARNYHSHARRDLANDAWVRMDGGRWVKSFSSTDKQWTWATRFEPSHGKFAESEFELESGWHTLEVSGRSQGFSIDRFHLFRSGAAGSDDPARPESVEFPPLNIEGIPAAWSALWEAGRPGSLLNTVRAASGAPGAEETERRILEYAEKRYERIQAAKAQDPLGASELLAMLAKQMSGTDFQKRYDEEARAWKSDPAARNEEAARKILTALEGRAAEIRSKGDLHDERYRKRQASALAWLGEGVRRLQQQYPQTRASQKALKLAEEFGLDGPGAAGFAR